MSFWFGIQFQNSVCFETEQKMKSKIIIFQIKSAIILNVKKIEVQSEETNVRYSRVS